MAEPVWFWQRMVSPHMAGLAAALAARGHEVTYVAEEEMSAERAAQGWIAPNLGQVALRLAPTSQNVGQLVQDAPADSIHICQAFRGNGLVDMARRQLGARGLRQWAIMETVDDAGWRGPLKRLNYDRLVRQWRPHMQGILAIGHRTPSWMADRGMPPADVFPFAYFLPDTPHFDAPPEAGIGPFRFTFAGRLIELKRIEMLLRALRRLEPVCELLVVGAGPLEPSLRALADQLLPGRVHWLGQRPIDEVPFLMATADCLVLPSRHDGWGAVISEALMAGTPAVCSDVCGAAGVVRASGQGGVFTSGDIGSLTELLARVLAQGRLAAADRLKLADWAQCLGAAAGARYLEAILAFRSGLGARPLAPWAASASALTSTAQGN